MEMALGFVEQDDRLGLGVRDERGDGVHDDLVAGAPAAKPADWVRGHGSRRIGAQVEKRSVGCQNTADLGEQVAAVHLADPGDDRTEFLGELLARLEEDALLAVESQRQRSEEHTSELQSLMRISYAVFCLKKKNKTNPEQK